jgi:hypothetical protein
MIPFSASWTDAVAVLLAIGGVFVVVERRLTRLEAKMDMIMAWIEEGKLR